MRPPLVAIVAALAVVMASTSACQFLPGSEDSQDIVIGADLELSGANAAIGLAYRRALELKVEQINAAKILGARKLVLDLKDNKSDRSLSQTNVSSFADRSDVAAVIMGACSDCVTTSHKLLNDRQMPTVALAPAHEVVNPVAERRYIFKLGPNPNDGAAALVQELRRAGVKKPALVVTDDKYGEEGQGALTRELQKAKDIQIVQTALIKPTDTDATQPVARALAAKPDSLIVWSLPGHATAAAVSAHNAGFKGRLFLDMSAAGELFLNGPVASATENAIMISTQTLAIDDVIGTSPAKAARKQWFRDYTARYGSYHGYASFAADAVQLIVNAIQTAGGTDRQRLRDIIENTQMDGLSGPIRLTPDNHSGLMPQALTALVARSGRWRVSG